MARRKSQAALEFLITYGWALLAILITLAALYYFGILDFAKYLPDRCLFTSQLECVDFVMKNNEIIFKLVNNLGEQITVQSISLTNDATPPLSCTPPAAGFSWNPSDEKDFTFTSCSGGGFIKNEQVEAKVTLTYFAPATPSQPLHAVNGKIQGRVQ
ncbi:hypothetical protein J4458_05730 [Candidatus Woesearchaeota archaeon]|nr:hypothetical protein [Candidatus Woesearchaeota archaeon]